MLPLPLPPAFMVFAEVGPELLVGYGSQLLDHTVGSVMNLLDSLPGDISQDELDLAATPAPLKQQGLPIGVIPGKIRTQGEQRHRTVRTGCGEPAYSWPAHVADVDQLAST